MNLLLVDDDQELTILLKIELEDLGHHVDTAFNGFDGKSLGLKNHYDVIILDLMLPGMNGHLICKELRNSKVDTPVMIISALDSPDERKAGASEGANDFMAKPFRFEEFYKQIVKLDKGHRSAKT
jgi:two-component system, OmpR family, copper resistance phosphate regulon response regulator CusR